jgi:hypothetical protein
MELYNANRQWSSRPADERFRSLHELAAFCSYEKTNSARRVMPNRGLTVVPSTTDPRDIAVSGPNGHPAQFTHWAFGQLCSLAGVPASYIRDSGMPGALAADCINWGLHHARDVESVSVLLRKRRDDAGNATVHLGAVNGPDYGVVWNADIADTLVREFGDGVTGAWRVPGEFGRKLDAVTKDNTTLYASDRDCWVFLADEERRVDVPNRRNGATGSLARGFYISNSEVGAQRLVLGMFLFDYVCCNRIIWGAEQHTEIKIRHTSGAPHRWLEEIKPVLREYAASSPVGVADTIANAQHKKIAGDVETFLATRFGKGIARRIQAAHMIDEARPVETVWDAVTGATAYARQLEHVDARVKIEREAGKLLQLVAA